MVDDVAAFIRGLDNDDTFEKTGLASLKRTSLSEKIKGVDFSLESNLAADEEKDNGSQETKTQESKT